jgi:hypothetical protein
MVLGLKQDLTASVERDFQAGGLYHNGVVSGFNLAVIAASMTFSFAGSFSSGAGCA